MKKLCFLTIFLITAFFGVRVVFATPPMIPGCVDIDVAQKTRAEKIVRDEYPELANLKGNVSFDTSDKSDLWCINFVQGGRPADKLGAVVNYVTPKSYSNLGLSYAVSFNVDVVDASGSVLTDALIEKPKNIRLAIEEFEKNQRVVEAARLFGIATSTIRGESITLDFLRGKISYRFSLRETNYLLPVADNYVNFPEIKLGISTLEKAGFRVPRTKTDVNNSESKRNGAARIIDGVYFLSGSNSETYGKDFDWATLNLDVIENSGKTVGLFVHVYADGRYLVEPEDGGTLVFGRITTSDGDCTFREFNRGSLPPQSLDVSFTEGCSSRLSPKFIFLDQGNQLVDDKNIEMLQNVENRASADPKNWLGYAAISFVAILVALCTHVWHGKMLNNKLEDSVEKDQRSESTSGKTVETRQAVDDL